MFEPLAIEPLLWPMTTCLQKLPFKGLWIMDSQLDSDRKFISRFMRELETFSKRWCFKLCCIGNASSNVDHILWNLEFAFSPWHAVRCAYQPGSQSASPPHWRANRQGALQLRITMIFAQSSYVVFFKKKNRKQLMKLSCSSGHPIERLPAQHCQCGTL